MCSCMHNYDQLWRDYFLLLTVNADMVYFKSVSVTWLLWLKKPD